MSGLVGGIGGSERWLMSGRVVVGVSGRKGRDSGGVSLACRQLVCSRAGIGSFDGVGTGGFRDGAGFDGGFVRVVDETRMMFDVVSSVGSIGGSG